VEAYWLGDKSLRVAVIFKFSFKKLAILLSAVIGPLNMTEKS